MTEDQEKIVLLEKKLVELEAKSGENAQLNNQLAGLNSLFNQSENSNDEQEIDLMEIIGALWNGRVLIIIVTCLFAVASIIYALSLPNIYKSTVKLVPVQQESDGGLSSLASKYGGLASMAGINLNNTESNSVMHAVELLKSWPYIESFTETHKLKPIFMAVKSWEPNTNKLIYDESMYDPANEKWLEETPFFSSSLKSLEPTSYETYENIMQDFFQISMDDDLSILSISVRHYSPQIAFELTNQIVLDINEYFRAKDQKEALASIAFLEQKIKTTSNADMLEVFYSMIEAQTQTLMLTEVDNEYLVKTLIPAKIAEIKRKDGPKRAQIVLIATALGAFLSCFFLIFSRIIFKKTES